MYMPAVKVKRNITALTICAATIMGATLAHAQQQASYEWPTTFRSGQAEFEFTRKDLGPQAPVEKLAGRGQTVANQRSLPSISLLIRSKVRDPFKEENPLSEEEEDLGTDVALSIEVPTLPQVDIQEELNMDEFKNYLDRLVETAAAQNTIDLSRYDFNHELKKVVISSMMTSPHAYVVINGKRFTEGDRFLLPVEVERDDSRVERLIEAQMPTRGTVSDEAYQRYEDLKNEALQKYRALRAENRQSETGDDQHNVSVTIKKIAHRKVTVSVNGQDYVLNVGMAL